MFGDERHEEVLTLATVTDILPLLAKDCHAVGSEVFVVRLGIWSSHSRMRYASKVSAMSESQLSGSIYILKLITHASCANIPAWPGGKSPCRYRVLVNTAVLS